MVKNLDHLQKEDRIHKELNFQNQNYLKSLKESQTAYDKLLREHKILVLAGIFDGEGSLHIKRSPEKKKTHKGNGYRMSIQCALVWK